MANWIQYDNKQNLLSMIDGQSILRNKNLRVFNDTVSRLHRLAEILEEQEGQLYGLLGVKDLAGLQNKLDNINSDEGFRSLNNLKDSSFDTMVLAAIQGVDLEKPITFVFEKDSIVKDKLYELSQQMAFEELTDVLKELRKTEKQWRVDSEHSLKGLHLSGSSSAGRGLVKTLGTYEIGLEGDSMVLKVLRKEGQIAKQEQLRDLADRLDATLIEESDGLRDNLERIILNTIQNDDLRLLAKQEFDQCGDWYDVNSSKASIKGFLGEIHANVTMKYLFPNLRTYATGNIRDLQGQEIPIDLVLEGFGFQIKNYRIENGETLFRYKGQAGNFIENRVQPTQSLEDLLITFFGAYQYHSKDAEFTQQAKERLVNGGAITSIFNAYLDNIMRISSTFGAKDNEQGLFMGKPELYYNTFFLISDKLVPASAMVWAISGELGKYSSSIFKTDWKFSEPVIEEAGERNSSPNVLANKINAELFLHLNVAKVLSVARARAVSAKGVDV